MALRPLGAFIGARLRTAATVAALAAAVFALSPAPARPAATVVGDCTPGANWGSLNASFAAQVLDLVNQHREAMGLGTLSTSPTLTAAAGWKSLHMAYYGYMTHDDPAPPVARTVSDRLVACGYPAGRVSWGENIAYGYRTPQDVMNAWLNSPGHRANIENASYRAIGIGAAVTPGGVVYWTQDFGSLVDAATPPSSSTPTSTTATVVTRTPPPPAGGVAVSFTQVPRGASSTQTVAWTTTGSPTSTTCSLDGAPATPCSSPKTLTGIGRGSHTFTVTVSNEASSAWARLSWRQ
jgi:uncharacterized protein YkwD